MTNSTQKALQAIQNGATLKDLRKRLGCAVSEGTLSRILSGKPVSRQAENKVRRALGLEPVYKRQRTRREMTKAQAARWDKMSAEERDRVLGLLK